MRFPPGVFFFILHHVRALVNRVDGLSIFRIFCTFICFYTTFCCFNRHFGERLLSKHLANQDTSCYALVVARRVYPVFWGEFT